MRDGHITLGARAPTRMMCEGSLMDSERAAAKMSGGTPGPRIDQRTLTLTSGNGRRVRVVAPG